MRCVALVVVRLVQTDVYNCNLNLTAAGSGVARTGRQGQLLVPASSEASFLSAMFNGVVGLISEPIRCQASAPGPGLFLLQSCREVDVYLCQIRLLWARLTASSQT